jgi:DNA invertase Pin-like site-specific DNA recombinase
MVVESVEMTISGRQEARPQPKPLMRAAHHHACAYVLLWEVDRLARSIWHVLHVLEACNHLRVGCMSVQDQLATASPMGKAMVTIRGAMAESASSLTSERVKVGMAAAGARVKQLGRPATPTHLVSWIKALQGQQAWAFGRGKRLSQATSAVLSWVTS